MDEKTILVNCVKMMGTEKMKADYGKTRDVILSCKNWEQLRVGVRMFNQLNTLHDLPERELNKLENLIGLMRIKCKGDSSYDVPKVVDEDTSNIGKEFRKATMGQEWANGIVFSEEEFVGGEADNKTPEDLAKKHDVDVSDIKKEIDIGAQIEKEHTDYDAVAREIAMDHIAEYSDYYSDENFGIIAIEKARGEGRKTIRISKSDMDKLHKDGKLNVDGISLSYQEDVAEATSAGASSGSYVGALGRPITRTFKKSEIPVSVNGMNLPIGKMYSFNEDKEILEEDDIEESVDYAGAVGSYETPKIWAGKDGWRGRTEKTYPGGKFVNIKKKCKKFPYCNQGSGGPGGSPITLTDRSEMKIDKVFGEGKVLKTVKKSNLKIKK